MKILLENKTYIEEAVLNDRNCVEYAKIFEKMSRYSMCCTKSVRETVAYKAYVPDLMFTLEEQAAVVDMFRTIRAHLLESMQINLDEALVNEGLWNDMKNAAKKTMDKTKEVGKNVINKTKEAGQKAVDKTKELGQKAIDAKDAILDKFKAAITFIDRIIKEGIATVRELVAAFGRLLIKLGENISTALTKLGAFRSAEAGDENTDANIGKEMEAAGIPENQRTFFSHVVEYATIAWGNKDTRTRMTEGFGSDVMDKVGNNSVFQFLFSVSKDRKRWSIFHTILVSLVGTFLISIVLPMFMTCLGAGTTVIVGVTTALSCIWATRSFTRVIFNRWLSKRPDEKFWNFATVLGVILSTVPVGLLRIPAVHEWVTDGLRSFLEWCGADKLINNIEELLGKLVEKCGGTNWTEETVETPGRLVKKAIESYQNAGDTHIDLMSGKNVHEYIDHLFADGSHIHNFKGNVSGLQKWFETIADQKFTNSADMINSMSGTAPSDAPLTVVLDGNTFGHVKRAVLQKAIESAATNSHVHCELVNVANEALRDSTSNMAGTSFAVVFDANATTENAHVIQNIMDTVAKEVGAKATPGLHTVCEFANKLADSFTEFHESVINTVITHKLFDTLLDCFNPVFNPFFKKEKWGTYKIRLGSNATGYPAFTVTEVRHMKLADVVALSPGNAALTVLVKHIQDVQKQHKDDIKAGINQGNNGSNGLTPKQKKVLRKHIKTYSRNNKIGDRELMVIFVDGTYKVKDNDGKIVEKKFTKEPIVAMDMQTMYCADLANWFPKRRKNIYPILGLLARLDFIPVEKNDNETKEFIYQLLDQFTATSVKMMVEGGTAACYLKVDNDGKFIPADPATADDSYFDTGCLTANQICDVLNEKIDAYTLIDGKYAKNVLVTIDKTTGEIKKKNFKDNLKLIEKKRYSKVVENGKEKYVEDKNGQYDYIDARIVPFVNKFCIDDLKADDDIADLFLNDNKDAVDVDMITDPVLNIKQYLYRPAKTFSAKDKTKLQESITKFLQGKSKKDIINAYNVCKRFIEIIWRKMSEVREKQVAKRTKQN